MIRIESNFKPRLEVCRTVSTRLRLRRAFVPTTELLEIRRLLTADFILSQSTGVGGNIQVNEQGANYSHVITQNPGSLITSINDSSSRGVYDDNVDAGGSFASSASSSVAGGSATFGSATVSGSSSIDPYIIVPPESAFIPPESDFDSAYNLVISATTNRTLTISYYNNAFGIPVSNNSGPSDTWVHNPVGAYLSIGSNAKGAPAAAYYYDSGSVSMPVTSGASYFLSANAYGTYDLGPETDGEEDDAYSSFSWQITSLGQTPILPRLVLNSTAEDDPDNVILNYTLSNGFPIVQPLTFNVYQTDKPYTDLASVLASVGTGASVSLGNTTLAPSDTGDLSLGSHRVNLALKTPISLDPTKPYIVVVANPNGLIHEAAGSINVVSAHVTTPPFTPSQIRGAYGINALATSMNGAGQTIAIVTAYNDPTIFNDVDTFDRAFGTQSTGLTLGQQYGQASAFLTVVNQNGNIIDPTSTNVPIVDAPNDPSRWAAETSLDVEWAHAIAPGAHIVLIECNNDLLQSLIMSGVACADQLADGVLTIHGVPKVSVVSMSLGYSEGAQIDKDQINANNEAEYDKYFDTQNVTYVAATGDSGSPGKGYPAFSPSVLAVGGTSLYLNSDDSYANEVGWFGSGGGPSLYESESAYQSVVQNTKSRTIPDVAFDGSGATGVYVYSSTNLAPGASPWTGAAGTSLGSPCWAALIAIVDQGRVSANRPPLTSGSQTLTALYDIATSNFHENLGSANNGTNNVNLTNPTRYNENVGLGTPVADQLVPTLINWMPVSLSSAQLPSGTVGVIYNQTITAIGGTGNKIVTVAIMSGTLPAGLSLNSQTNEVSISGKPTARGTVRLYVTATDSEGLSASEYYTLRINAQTNVPIQVSTKISGLVYNRATQLFGGIITITNIGSTTLTGSLQVELTGLPAGVSLANANGTDANGNPFILVTLINGMLSPGQSINVTVLFNNPKKLSFQYGTSIFDVQSSS